MTIFGYTPAQLKKMLIAAVGFSLAVFTAAAPIVPAAYLPFAIGAIGFLSTLGVALARNAENTPAVEPAPVLPPLE